MRVATTLVGVAIVSLVGLGLTSCGPSSAERARMQMDAEEAAARAHKHFCANYPGDRQCALERIVNNKEGCSHHRSGNCNDYIVLSSEILKETSPNYAYRDDPERRKTDLPK